MDERIRVLAQKIQEQTKERLMKQYKNLDFDFESKTTIIPGRKYIKIDVGNSGKFMIDNDGNIFGIKGYGIINKKKQYGNLDTIDDFYWGGWAPIRKE